MTLGFRLDISKRQSQSLDLYMSADARSETYARLTREVTAVIHGAWIMDFNRTVEEFTPCLDGKLQRA